MNLNFKKCLEQNKIHISQGIDTASLRELQAAQKDLASAERNFEVGDYKWSTTQSYAAMFHAGRSLLYSEGYKERGHFSLLVALESLFVENGKLSRMALNRFQKARELREAADYDLEFGRKTAEIILSGAGQFIKEARTILEN